MHLEVGQIGELVQDNFTFNGVLVVSHVVPKMSGASDGDALVG